MLCEPCAAPAALPASQLPLAKGPVLPRSNSVTGNTVLNMIQFLPLNNGEQMALGQGMPSSVTHLLSLPLLPLGAAQHDMGMQIAMILCFAPDFPSEH